MSPVRSTELHRARGLCAVAYVVAFIAACATLRWAPVTHGFWRVVVADVVGTCVIFGFSRAFDNSSFYDAYWSVAPIGFVLFWTLSNEVVPARAWLVTGLVCAWGLRLTYNWARHWRGLAHEDWRYVDLRHQTGALYWLVSLFGLHLFPTVMVLAGSTSVWVATTTSTPLGALDAAAVVITGGAIVIEAVADAQLHRFVRDNRDKARIMATGLWGWSRHPNYFGEASFWWGLFVFALAASADAWWTAVGPSSLTAMFLVVSIPLIEKRMLEKRPGYREHQRRISRLIPLPPPG